ncbi:MAG: hypothetical protein ACYTFI_00785 [Planctomycetota bacterium]
MEDADLDSLDTKVTFIFDIEGGRWKIDTSTNKMYFYKADGTSEVAVFTLKDAAGVAGYDDPYERTRD